jgi:hypothetical protein
MVTGSLAGILHGVPRTTQDIDIVIAPTQGTLKALLASFPGDAYYVDTRAAFQALASESMFNVIDLGSGWKVDFIIRKSRPFSIREFERRVEAEFWGSRLFVASAEDTVLAKLEWAKLGGSERQIRDVAGILRTQGGVLDRPYVEHWVGSLGLQQEWNMANDAARER